MAINDFIYFLSYFVTSLTFFKDFTNLLPIYSDSSLCFAVIHFQSLNMISSLILNILIKFLLLPFIRQRTLHIYTKDQKFTSLNYNKCQPRVD